jgi:hypothetical protein
MSPGWSHCNGPTGPPVLIPGRFGSEPRIARKRFSPLCDVDTVLRVHCWIIDLL